MKTKILIILILLSISIESFSKGKYLIELNNNSVQFSDFNFYISEVIDERFQNDNFGFIVVGILDLKKEIEFKSGVSSSIQNYANALIIRNENAEDIKLRIRELKISEGYDFDDNGTCKITLEYLDSLNNLIYMTELKGTLPISEPSKNIDKLICTLVKKSLLIFSLYDRDSDTYFDLLNKQRLYDTIIKSGNLKKGFYTNYKEFQANNPSIKKDFKIIEVKDKNRNYLQINFADPLFDSDSFLDLVYGFSDGQNIYLKKYLSNNNYSLIPIKTVGRYCYIGKISDRQGIPFILPFAAGFISAPYEQDYIMNISSGKEHPLTDETLKHILITDSELYNHYLNQPYDSRVNNEVFWLNEFNKRYLKNIDN